MSHTRLIRPAARADIDAAYAWYEAQQAGRGDDFLDELYGRFRDIEAAPDRYGFVRGRVRAAPLPTSKYVVYYRIDGNQVTVLAVRHARSNPRGWQGRK